VRNGRLARIRWLASTGRLARLARLMGLGRNPLRRRSDRIEAWISAGLLAVLLIIAPLAATSAGRWVHRGGLQEQQAQRSWHQISAVLLQTAPALPIYQFRVSWQTTVAVPARWPGAGGQTHSGKVAAPVGSQAGQTVPVWVDSSGRATGSPLLGSQLTRRVIAAEVLAPLVLAVILLGVAFLARWLLNRRRLADWEADWAAIGPRWTRRHRH
jgi:hypothetical protein